MMENFNNQGRDDRQYEDSMKIMTIGTLGLGVIIVGMIVYGILS